MNATVYGALPNYDTCKGQPMLTSKFNFTEKVNAYKRI